MTTFDDWLYSVCYTITLKTKREMTDIYSTINLSEAKLAFVDGQTATEYVDFNKLI